VLGAISHRFLMSKEFVYLANFVIFMLVFFREIINTLFIKRNPKLYYKKSVSIKFPFFNYHYFGDFFQDKPETKFPFDLHFLLNRISSFDRQDKSNCMEN